MRKVLPLVLLTIVGPSLFGQISPVTPGELSSTRLLTVERLAPDGPDQGPDGLSFCFLVSRKPPAEHKLGLKAVGDFGVDGRSYRRATETTLGRVFEPKIVIHDLQKYVAAHPDLEAAVAGAPSDSLILTVAISGVRLEPGQAVEMNLPIGFGRTPDAPEVERLVFRTEVPSAR